MAVIRISIEEVEAGAQLFRDKSQEMADDVTLLQSAVDGFADVWEGKAFGAFQQEFTDLRGDIDRFVQLIDEIGQQLTSIKEAMIRADEDIASQIGVK